MIFLSLLTVLPLVNTKTYFSILPRVESEIIQLQSNKEWSNENVEIGTPDLSDPTKVVIPFIVHDPASCCFPTTLVFPGFKPEWGTYTSLQAGVDLEVDWFIGIEYMNYDTYAKGKLAAGWYWPNHNNKHWPDRDDLDEISDNHWDCTLSMVVGNTTYQLVDAARSYGKIAYAYNSENVFPYTPADGVKDYKGTSGGSHHDVQGSDPFVYGEPIQVSVTTPTIRLQLDCQGWTAFTASIIGLTEVYYASHATLKGEIIYYRN